MLFQVIAQRRATQVLPRVKEQPRFDWVRLLVWIAVGSLVVWAITAFAIIPAQKDWNLGTVYGFREALSMAVDTKDGGIMPYSYYYTKPMDSYTPGDTISFMNRFGEQADQGKTIKKLFLIHDGWYYSRGLNAACSNEWYACRMEDIQGKMVAGPYKLLPIPERFWKWLTLNWTLGYDNIIQRNSLMLHPNMRFRFFRNVVLSQPMTQYTWSADKQYCMTSSGQVFKRDGTIVSSKSVSRLISLDESRQRKKSTLVYIDKRGVRHIYDPDKNEDTALIEEFVIRHLEFSLISGVAVKTPNSVSDNVGVAKIRNGKIVVIDFTTGSEWIHPLFPPMPNPVGLYFQQQKK